MSSVHLDFKLRDQKPETPDVNQTLVTTTINVAVLSEDVTSLDDLVLDCEDIQLRGIKVNGVETSEYTYDNDKLTIPSRLLPQTKHFQLETLCALNPSSNLQLSGLYKSSGMYCTQCEAEGFRRITPFWDRPDMMTKYTVRLEAEKEKYPVLLSNGNKVESGQVDDLVHYAIWEDPHNKPSYLFALVAGDLASISDTYTTTSHRKVHLEIFSDKGNEDQLEHAMVSLKKAMKWDEDRLPN